MPLLNTCKACDSYITNSNQPNIKAKSKDKKESINKNNKKRKENKKEKQRG